MEDQQTLLPGHLAAARAGVSKQLLHYWRRAGRLPVAEYRDGRPLYRIRDVLEAERATRNSPHSRRAA